MEKQDKRSLIEIKRLLKSNILLFANQSSWGKLSFAAFSVVRAAVKETKSAPAENSTELFFGNTNHINTQTQHSALDLLEASAGVNADTAGGCSV